MRPVFETERSAVQQICDVKNYQVIKFAKRAAYIFILEITVHFCNQ